MFGKNKFLFAVLFITILLRIPSLFEPYWYGDEGIYLTLGEAIRQGLVLYRDIYDNKPPLLYLLTALSGNLFWFRFMLLIANTATVYFFYKLAQNLLSCDKKIIKVATLIFAVLSSLPLIEGNIANAEIFMILPAIVGFYLILEKERLSFHILFTAGLLFSIAMLFKVPAILDFGALLFFLLCFKFRWQFFSKLLFFPLLLGFLLPLAATLIYFWSQNALSQYFTAAFLQNFSYLSSWQTGSHINWSPSTLSVRALILLVFLFLVWLWFKKDKTNFVLIPVWFLFALFGATLSGRPYPHYLIQLLPPSCLLVGGLCGKEIRRKIAFLVCLGLLVLALIYYRFWNYPVFSYYQNFTLFALGKGGQAEYFSWFNPKVPQTYNLARFLITHTNPRERVFLWGDSPMVYALSHRLPVGQYTASYHIIDLEAYNEVIGILQREKPRFIIDLDDETRSFPQLNSLLAQQYVFIQKIGQARIFSTTPY